MAATRLNGPQKTCTCITKSHLNHLNHAKSCFSSSDAILVFISKQAAILSRDRRQVVASVVLDAEDTWSAVSAGGTQPRIEGPLSLTL